MKSTSRIRAICTSLISVLFLSTTALFSALNVEAPTDDFLALIFGATAIIMAMVYTIASYWGKVSVPSFAILFVGYFIAFITFEVIMGLYGHHRGVAIIMDGLICLFIMGASLLLRCFDAGIDEEESDFLKIATDSTSK